MTTDPNQSEIDELKEDLHASKMTIIYLLILLVVTVILFGAAASAIPANTISLKIERTTNATQ